MPDLRSPSRVVGAVHFEDLHGLHFERLVFAYLLRQQKWRSLNWLGLAGSDGGRDIIGARLDGKQVCIQCANYRVLTSRKTRADLKRLKTLKRPLPFKLMIVAGGTVSATTRERCEKDARKAGIREVEVWSGPEFEERVRKDAEPLLERFLKGAVFPESPEALARVVNELNKGPALFDFVRMCKRLPDVYGHLRYLGLPISQRWKTVTLAQQFVHPILESPNSEAGLKRARLSLSRFARDWRRTVIAGPVGSGKTTLCHAMALWVSGHLPLPRARSPRLVPLVAKLRDFESMDLIEELRAQLQATFAEVPSREALEAQLGRNTALLLDGFDEMPDDIAREKLVVQLDAMLAKHPNLRLLITTRPESAARVPIRLAQELRVAPFDAMQTEEFSQKWATRTSQRAEALTELLQKTVHARGGMESTPLTLSLLALLHEGGIRASTSRVELWNQLLVLLVEDWPQGRGQSSDTHSGTQITVLEELAWWFATRSRENKTRFDVERELAKIVARHRVAKKGAYSEALARTLIHYFTDQIGILTRPGPIGLEMAHLSLQEFLAARHLTRQGQQVTLQALNTPWLGGSELGKWIVELNPGNKPYLDAVVNRFKQAQDPDTILDLATRGHDVGEDILHWCLNWMWDPDPFNSERRPGWGLLWELRKRGGRDGEFVSRFILDKLTSGSLPAGWEHTVSIEEVRTALQKDRSKTRVFEMLESTAFPELEAEIDERTVLDWLYARLPFEHWAMTDAVMRPDRRLHLCLWILLTATWLSDCFKRNGYQPVWTAPSVETKSWMRLALWRRGGGERNLGDPQLSEYARGWLREFESVPQPERSLVMLFFCDHQSLRFEAGGASLTAQLSLSLLIALLTGVWPTDRRFVRIYKAPPPRDPLNRCLWHTIHSVANPGNQKHRRLAQIAANDIQMGTGLLRDELKRILPQPAVAPRWPTEEQLRAAYALEINPSVQRNGARRLTAPRARNGEHG